MIALSGSGTSLTAFNSTELFNAAMIRFNHPSALSKAQALEVRQLEVIGGPVVNVAVWSDYLEHANEAIALEMDLCAIRTKVNLVDAARLKATACPSGLTSRFALSRVSQRQPKSRISLRFGKAVTEACKRHAQARSLRLGGPVRLLWNCMPVAYRAESLCSRLGLLWVRSFSHFTLSSFNCVTPICIDLLSFE